MGDSLLGVGDPEEGGVGEGEEIGGVEEGGFGDVGFAEDVGEGLGVYVGVGEEAEGVEDGAVGGARGAEGGGERIDEEQTKRFPPKQGLYPVPLME